MSGLFPRAQRRAREPEALYVHIPFCVRKCSYCDFVSGPAATARRRSYLEDLALEAAQLPQEFVARTVFVGGGTPSMLLPAEIARLGEILQPFIGEASEEVSFEGNPGTLSRERLEAFQRVGATRVSMGAQTFDPAGLQRLGRIHSAEDVERAAREVQRLGMALNIDLIYGYPGQTAASLEYDLDCMLGLDPGHISAYCLIYEPGTPLFAARAAGKLPLVGDEQQDAMYARVRARLREAGYEQYEVSNYARPGKECLHNLIYWRNEAYHALGVSATSFVDGERATRISSLDAYGAELRQGRQPLERKESLRGLEEAAETLMLALRLRSGVERGWFAERTGFDLDQFVGERLAPLIEGGWLEDDGQVLRVSPQGMFVADTLTTQLWPDTLAFPEASTGRVAAEGNS